MCEGVPEPEDVDPLLQASRCLACQGCAGTASQLAEYTELHAAGRHGLDGPSDQLHGLNYHVCRFSVRGRALITTGLKLSPGALNGLLAILFYDTSHATFYSSMHEVSLASC